MTDDERQEEIRRQLQIHRKLTQAGAFSLFVPSAFQRPWLTNEKKITTVIKGNQVGGTTCAVIRMLSACLGTRPLSMGGIVPADWGQIQINETPGMYLLMSQSFTKTVPEVILPKIREFMAPSMLKKPPKKHGTGVPYIFHFKSGAELHLGSYDQPAESFEGPLWNGICFDEPPPRDIYVACRRGTMRTRGWIMFTMTPLKELWVYDELHLPAQQGKLDDVAPFEAHSHLNCRQCNPNEGHIEHKELEAFFQSLTPNERRAREMGIPLDITDIRYYWCTRETHVCPDIW